MSSYPPPSPETRTLAIKGYTFTLVSQCFPEETDPPDSVGYKLYALGAFEIRHWWDQATYGFDAKVGSCVVENHPSPEGAFAALIIDALAKNVVLGALGSLVLEGLNLSEEATAWAHARPPVSGFPNPPGPRKPPQKPKVLSIRSGALSLAYSSGKYRHLDPVARLARLVNERHKELQTWRYESRLWGTHPDVIDAKANDYLYLLADETEQLATRIQEDLARVTP